MLLRTISPAVDRKLISHSMEIFMKFQNNSTEMIQKFHGFDTEIPWKFCTGMEVLQNFRVNSIKTYDHRVSIFGKIQIDITHEF